MRRRIVVLEGPFNGSTLPEKVRKLYDNGASTQDVEVVTASDMDSVSNYLLQGLGGVNVVVVPHKSIEEGLPEMDAEFVVLGTGQLDIPSELDNNHTVQIAPTRPKESNLTAIINRAISRGEKIESQKKIQTQGNHIGVIGLGAVGYALSTLKLRENMEPDTEEKTHLHIAMHGSTYEAKVGDLIDQFYSERRRVHKTMTGNLPDNCGHIIIAADASSNDLTDRREMYRYGNAEMIMKIFEHLSKSGDAALPMYTIVTNDSYLIARQLSELSVRTGSLWNVVSPAELDVRRAKDVLRAEIVSGGALFKPDKRLPPGHIFNEDSTFRVSGTHGKVIVLPVSSRIYNPKIPKGSTIAAAYGVSHQHLELLASLIQQKAEQWKGTDFPPDTFAKSLDATLKQVSSRKPIHLGIGMYVENGVIYYNPDIEVVRAGNLRFGTAYISDWARVGVPTPERIHNRKERELVERVLEEEDEAYRGINLEVFGQETLTS